jgi:uncharacterized protein YbbC (DUF1343 family)
MPDAATAAARPTVRTGLDRVVADPGLLGPGPVGLVTNFTGVTSISGRIHTAAEALTGAGVGVSALFGPEHGLRGTAQAGGSEADPHDPASGLPVYDTYRMQAGDLDALLRQSGVAALVFDLQDLGARFYTYIWTMFDLMLAAARTGCRFVVLDRPNPITGLVSAGPVLEPAYASFVGRAPIPIRYGLTCAELARHLQASQLPDVCGRALDLQVVPMQGWRRSMWFDQTGLVWVPPSPNVPTLDTAVVYPGTCLFEGTTFSEGRGTTRPFELVGAPFVDARYGPALADRGLAGVLFRDAWFTPTFHKYAGQAVRGVHLHVTDRSVFDPVRTAVVMMDVARQLYPEFGMREHGVPGLDLPPSNAFGLDRLWGSDQLRRCLQAGDDPTRLLPGLRSPQAWVSPGALLYR